MSPQQDALWGLGGLETRPADTEGSYEYRPRISSDKQQMGGRMALVERFVNTSLLYAISAMGRFCGCTKDMNYLY
jgi:hypothetical protein